MGQVLPNLPGLSLYNPELYNCTTGTEPLAEMGQVLPNLPELSLYNPELIYPPALLPVYNDETHQKPLDEDVEPEISLASLDTSVLGKL